MKKKLIEVALPLEAINRESAREKSIRHGHPSTLHLWWARRPLAACRAVLFASLVDDPSSLPEQFPTEADQDKERQRLFRLIEKLVLWENSNNRSVLDEAHAEILKSTGGNPPPIYDPFCGGGSIPLEAQRLGLEAHGSDLNPVAVLITKALIEIPPKFAGQPPVNPAAKNKMSGKGMWTGARGLADDVRYYGQWMRDRAGERIGHIYPKVTLPKAQGGGEATVIATLWARTIECPNPACGAQMPMVRSFLLSTKPGKKAWVHPIIDHVSKTVRFEVETGDGTPPEGTKQRGTSRCLFCGNAISDASLRQQAKIIGTGSIPMAVVAEGQRGRIYLPPESLPQVNIAIIETSWLDQPLPDNARWFSPPGYGLPNFKDLFTARQLVTLTTLSDLVPEARDRAVSDGANKERADAIAVYLALSASKSADNNSTLCSWMSGLKYEVVRNTFSRQALPMTWDYAESNPFAESSGDFFEQVKRACLVLELAVPATGRGAVEQLDATTLKPARPVVFCTDPPYYDNIGYADLSDFFYVWLRRALHTIYPQIFSTLLVPKAQELVATPYRFGGSKEKAQEFFEAGFVQAFARVRSLQEASYPLTIFYAFKQTEETDEESSVDSLIASTGWETMLEGLLQSAFQVTGTWPMRSERSARTVAVGTNALASSIVLVCRPRSDSAPITTRKDFLSALKKELPHSLRNMQKGNIAPVDLAQAAIGPGMAVFSRYKKVLETDGSPMRVRTALALINQGLDEVLSELESEFDPDTRWALAWFEQHQFDEGLYGEAEVLATAKALSISHLAEVGILQSRAGKVRLLRREELPEDWDPSTIRRLTVWEVTQHLIRRLDQKGEKETANLKAKIGGMAEIARDLSYRLYTLCERKGWAEEAGYYNSLVVAWPSMASEAFHLE
jgi:putative DNA methylase